MLLPLARSLVHSTATKLTLTGRDCCRRSSACIWRMLRAGLSAHAHHPERIPISRPTLAPSGRPQAHQFFLLATRMRAETCPSSLECSSCRLWTPLELRPGPLNCIEQSERVSSVQESLFCWGPLFGWTQVCDEDCMQETQKGATFHPIDKLPSLTN